MKEAKETSLPEGRPRPEDDLSEEAGDRTQGRASPPAGLERVQMAARRSRQTQFTALLHHVDEAALLRSFRGHRGLFPKSYAKDGPGVGVRYLSLFRFAVSAAAWLNRLRGMLISANRRRSCGSSSESASTTISTVSSLA